jgi:hypothetical protein
MRNTGVAYPARGVIREAIRMLEHRIVHEVTALARGMGRRCQNTLMVQVFTQWKSSRDLYHACPVTGSACPKLLVGPLALVANSSAGFNLAGGSTFASFIAHNATVGTLARRFGGAFVGSDAIDKASVGSVRDRLVSVLAHVFSLRDEGQEWQSGIPLMEVSSGA